jgi:hypothetical protein
MKRLLWGVVMPVCALGCSVQAFRGSTVIYLPKAASVPAELRCKAVCEAKCGGSCWDVGRVYRECMVTSPDARRVSGRTFGEALDACLKRAPDFASKHPFSYTVAVQSDENAPPPRAVVCSVTCR